jgi:hypothetical protein
VDKFGEVSDAYIVLRGCLCPTLPTSSRGDLFRCEQLESGAWRTINTAGLENFLLYWDVLDNQWMSGLTLNVMFYDESVLPEDEAGETSQVIYLLRVYTYPKALALMLRASQARRGGFIRVGLAEECRDSMFDGLPDVDVTIY